MKFVCDVYDYMNLDAERSESPQQNCRMCTCEKIAPGKLEYTSFQLSTARRSSRHNGQSPGGLLEHQKVIRVICCKKVWFDERDSEKDGEENPGH